MFNLRNDLTNNETWDLFITKGNEKAFSKIYYDHYKLLYYIGLKYTTHNQIIEDSIQNVFVYLLKNREKLGPVSNIRAYLVKSFRNQLSHDLKKQNRLTPTEQLSDSQFDYFNGTEHAIFEKEEMTEMYNTLQKSLQKLSTKQQEIIYLRFDCELSYEEISGILDISIDSCYKSIYRSIKAIKADIEQPNISPQNLFFWITLLHTTTTR